MTQFDIEGRWHFCHKEIGEIVVDNEKIVVLDTEGKEQFVCKDGIIRISTDFPTYDQLYRFKQYFDDLYGQGLEVVNWHMNVRLKPFDNLYDAAIEYMNKENNDEV